MNDVTKPQVDPFLKYKKNPNIREVHRVQKTTKPVYFNGNPCGMPELYEQTEIFYQTVFLKTVDPKYPDHFSKLTGKMEISKFKEEDSIFLRKTVVKHDGKYKSTDWLVMDDLNYHPILGYKMRCDTFERLQTWVYIRKEWQ